ncbi:MAG: UDP-3-O-(3-hydroxymyristoyl)glucosamine N-acyltransferase [Acidobacteriota bacterium]|nr:UDP-3-O-(3-hydroxymyristoyl)glucosamine N-acyltransferase [Acidobacteriota bacterium]
MKLVELAQRIGARLEGGAPETEVTGVASLASATANSLTFVEQEKYLEAALLGQAAATLIPEGLAVGDPRGKALLRVKHPRLAFARAAAELRRSTPAAGGVHPTAVVEAGAEIDATAAIGAHVFVGAGAKIGARTKIGPGSVIGEGVSIGEDGELVARVTVYAGTTIGDRVCIHAGAVLGGDGFGFVPDPETGEYFKFPQIGTLQIGNDVEIGANTAIDRGALDATVVSDGVKLDNLVHLGHNVRVGRNVVIAAQTGISGSTVLEDNVIVAGQVGLADHVHIGPGVILGAQCGVPTKKIVNGPGQLFWGTPARPIKQYLKELATLSRLAKK